MSKVQQGFECRSEEEEQARSERWKYEAIVALAFPYKIEAWSRRQAGREGVSRYRLPHGTVVYYAHTANVVIANGRETHGIPYAKSPKPSEANKKPIRISHSEQALRQINILAHNNKRAKAKGRGRGEQREQQVRTKKAVDSKHAGCCQSYR